MKKLNRILLLLALAYAVDLTSQSTWSKHYDLNIGNDYAKHVVPVEKGIVLLAKGFCDFNFRECTGLLKIGLDGMLIKKTIIYDTLETNSLTALAADDDTLLLNMNYYISGQTPGCSVLSFDQNCNYISRFDYYQDKPFSAQDLFLRKGGDAYVQYLIKQPTSDKYIEYTRCYDKNWNLLWDMHVPEFGNAHRTKSAICLDRGLVIAYTQFPGGGQDLVFHVEKYSKDGELQWHTKYPYGCDNHDQTIKINAMPDGSYIGAFVSDSFALISSNIQVWFKLDAKGNRLWEKANIFEERVIYNSFVNHSGNIIACGNMPDYHFDTIQDPNNSGYIMCMNSGGERLWERKILDHSTGVANQYLYGGTELPNGDLVFVGEVWDTITSPENPTYGDMWVIKTDSMGCFEPGCGDWQVLVGTKEPSVLQPVSPFYIFPNPARDYCNLMAKLGETIPSGQYSVRVYDSLGHFLFAKDIDPMHLNRLDLNNVPIGACTVVVLKDGSEYQSYKVLRQ